MVNHCQELLGFGEEECLTEHEHNSQNDGLLGVIVIGLFETTILAHSHDEHNVLYHNSDTNYEYD